MVEQQEYQARLWARLDGFEIDRGSPELAFESRLARENGWSEGFARRVVGEYKRFVFLAMVAGHPVTPSDEVDQAWHLHLTYTRSYWDGLCGEVRGEPLHHGPTAGGREENQKFWDWYQRTLDSYRQVFGTTPPTDVWPLPSDRFRDAACFRRVNDARVWTIPKPRVPFRAVRWRLRTLPAAAMAAALVALGALISIRPAGAAGLRADERSDDWTNLERVLVGGAFIAAVLALVLLMYAVRVVARAIRLSAGRCRRCHRWRAMRLDQELEHTKTYECANCGFKMALDSKITFDFSGRGGAGCGGCGGDG